VASGFEHSIANMYFMFLGMLLKGSEKVAGLANIPEGKLASVGWEGFFHNLIPVTIGNVIGGVFFVAILYFVVFKDKLKEN
jgi:formate/nitrite transporter FocA (FNT family)